MPITGTRTDGLTERQEMAIVALMSEPGVRKAAESCGIPQSTLYRWLKEDRAFGEAYRAARRDSYSQAIGLVQQYAPLAVKTLGTVMADKDAPASAKVAAATALLKIGREGVELDDLAARLEALEVAAENAGE